MERRRERKGCLADEHEGDCDRVEGEAVGEDVEEEEKGVFRRWGDWWRSC